MGWCAQGLRSATRPAGKRRGEGGGRGGRRRRVLGEGRHDRPGARAGGLPPRRRGSVCGWEGWSERSGVRSRAQRGADLADARERCRPRRARPRRSSRAHPGVQEVLENAAAAAAAAAAEGAAAAAEGAMGAGAGAAPDAPKPLVPAGEGVAEPGWGDAAAVGDFLRILEEHRQACERSGQYMEAEVAARRLKELRAHEEARRRDVLKVRAPVAHAAHRAPRRCRRAEPLLTAPARGRGARRCDDPWRASELRS